MGKGIKIKQHDITDCGAACISSVCAYYGLKYPIARIRQYAFTDQKGTNVLGMIEALKRLGFTAKGVKAQLDALQMIPLPTIAHVMVKDALYHFVVIYKVSEKWVTYMDPADGHMHKVKHMDFRQGWTGVLILTEPDESFKSGDMKQSTAKKFLSLLAPHKSVMTQAIFGALIYSVLGLSTSVFVGKITDYVLVDENTNLLNLMGVVMIIIIALRTFIGAMKSILALKTGQRIDAALILGYYKHLLKLPQQFFDTMRVGEIISRVNDAVKIRTFINNVSLDLVVNAMILVFSVGLMFVYSWQLALITLGTAPLFYLIYSSFNTLNKKYQRKIMESAADLESQMVESITSVATIKKFGIEEYANTKTENKFVRLLRNTYTSIQGSILANGGIQFVSSAITVVILWTGSYFVIDKSLTPGTLMIFYSLISYVMSPISSLITSNQSIQDALIAADRLFQIMDLEREEDNSPKVKLTKDNIGNIVFSGVSFRYGSRKQIFENLNLTIEKGKTTAIVGESGSGKTTLASLLQNIYPIQSGKISIGDYDLTQISNVSLRNRIGTVPQNIELFAGTVMQNIALGMREPDAQRVCHLIMLLGLQGLVEELPKGLLTNIGEQGVSLSGGERQRLAIARALYNRPSILIFDEATSSLDSISESYVKKVLSDWRKLGKTIIIIAHRLSSVKNADKIVVMKHGMVVEEGKHDDLIAANGEYSKLWNEQTTD